MSILPFDSPDHPAVSARSRIEPAPAAEPRRRGSAWLVAWVYLGLALPIVLVHVFALAPFQVPDEENHFLRIVQIAKGDLVGRTLSGDAAGGRIDAAAAEVARRFDHLHFRPDRKVEPAAVQEARRWRWGERGEADVAFGNTVIYPPFFYVPAAAAVRVGQARGWPILDTLYVGRLATGALALALSALALALAVRGQALMFAVLLLPTTLGLYGSVSQDALLIASVALVIGLCSRAVDAPERIGDTARVAAAVLVGAVVAARPPYAPLIALFALQPMCLRGRDGGGFPRPILTALPLMALSAAIALVWTLFGAGPAKIPFRAADGVSISGQLVYLAANPAALVTVPLNTLARLGEVTTLQFLGVLGWLDIYLPRYAYFVAGATILIAAWVGTLVVPGPGTLAGRERWGVLAAVLVTVSGIYGAQYLSWTPVGDPIIDGVQGRYFIPAALALALALPGGPRAAPNLLLTGRTWSGTRVLLGWGALIALAAINFRTVPWMIFLRYHG